jgi:MFS family permease
MRRIGATSQSDTGKWMALLAALLGWMFDGFEIGMFPLIGPNALDELLRNELVSNPTIKGEWFGVIMAVFLVGAATGGVAFGWLGDRIGRVKAMSLSILTYAIFTGLCGFAGEAWHIAVLRFIASLGMGGEWSLGVALVTELWPDRSRAVLAGLIGAAANVGFLAVGLLSLVMVSFIQRFGEFLLAAGLPETTIDILLRGDGWRLLMIAGALPALLVFFIRLFVPESHKWEAARNEQETSYWATQDLLGVLVGAVGATLMIALWSPVFMAALRPYLNAQGHDLSVPIWVNVLRICGTAAGFRRRIGWLLVSRDALSVACDDGRPVARRRSSALLETYVARRLSRGDSSAGNVGLVAMGAQVGDRSIQSPASRWRPLLREGVCPNRLFVRSNRRRYPRRPLRGDHRSSPYIRPLMRWVVRVSSLSVSGQR